MQMTDEAWKGILGHAAVVGTLFYGVQKFSKEIEEKLSDEARAALARWLEKGGSAKTSALTFKALFDGIFGSRHLSWRCFTVSAAVTMVLTVTWGVALGFHRLLDIWTVIAYAAANIPHDYLSLWVTRLVMTWMTRTAWFTALVLLTFDLVVSSLIGFIGWGHGTAFSLSWHTLVSQGPEKVLPVMQLLAFPWTAAWEFAENPGKAMFHPLYLVPSLLTSVWIWLYVLAGGLMRLTMAHSIFDVRRKPLQAVGLITAALVALAYGIFAVNQLSPAAKEGLSGLALPRYVVPIRQSAMQIGPPAVPASRSRWIPVLQDAG